MDEPIILENSENGKTDDILLDYLWYVFRKGETITPSSTELAKELGIRRSLIDESYERLEIKGYVSEKNGGKREILLKMAEKKIEQKIQHSDKLGQVGTSSDTMGQAREIYKMLTILFSYILEFVRKSMNFVGIISIMVFIYVVLNSFHKIPGGDMVSQWWTSFLGWINVKIGGTPRK
jgi:DNA-binding transcriptional regulator YhcF (GntR family)